MPAKQPICFACAAASEETVEQAVLLARSLRAFGGRLADSDFALFASEAVQPAAHVRAGLVAAGVRQLTFELPDEAACFPYAELAHAAAAAELSSEGTADRLAWLNSDALVLAEPAEFLLGPGQVLGYRPVHHMLIGSLYEEPLDSFWSTVYELCGVRSESVFPMTTCADARRIRPYYNAGLLVVRPDAGILRRWRDTFAAHFADPTLTAIYDRDARYRIFAHQALLTGSILVGVRQSATVELPDRYNYPLHLHEEYELSRRPASLAELVTCRYDSSAGWQSLADIEVPEPYASWLRQHGSGPGERHPGARR